jgi:hypothetical protein
MKREKPRKYEAVLEAADGIRTHDLLDGKQYVRSRVSKKSPGKERFPSYRGSAMLPSFYREIAGVSGLKPDWRCRESLGVDFRAWRSGGLKSSGTSGM